ncbi:Ribulose bisphosphate carboxylase/oxygenase activase, chloroplastic, partial [Cucurbita argyrosperma subsp. sororia]
MVNATLMNIADNQTNVQLPGLYNKEENPRVPIIVTGNDFSTLYAPLIRDGRMEKFYGLQLMMIVLEQENVKRVKLAEKYLKEAALGDANEDVLQFQTSLGK